MKGLRDVCGVGRRDKVKNVRIKEMCGWRKSLVERAEESMLRWFGHVCRINEEGMAKKVCISEVKGVSDRGRPRESWMSNVKELLKDRRIN